MSVAGAGVHKAIAALWESGGLNTKFQAYWSVVDRSLHTSLNDGEAAPGTPFPYAVFTARAPNVSTRMTGDGAASKQHINDQPWTFEVHAGPSGTSSAKEVAAAMAEEIMKVFGGHPTQSPTLPALDVGAVLIVQCQNDWGERESDEVHRWTIEYNIRTDVPVAV